MPSPESTHIEPKPRKRRRKRDDPQSCFLNSEEYHESDDCSPMSCSDVESFQGKIVYNADGSAYIIDSENESLSNVSENCMNVGATTSTNNPKIHSFRVVTARDASIYISEPNKIQKPILMCFICKLSFGNTKSFSLHANSEHTLNLQESEKLLLNREYSSAIIQRNVDEKPQISFLEPLDMQKQHLLTTKQLSQAQQQEQTQQQDQQQQQLVGGTPSLIGNCSSTSQVISTTPSCTTASSSSLASLSASTTSATSSAVAVAAAANAALVTAIAASCSNTNSNNSTSISSTSAASIMMNTSHLESDVMTTNPDAGISNNTGNCGIVSSSCSQVNQQHRTDSFENANTLDLSASTTAALAVTETAVTDDRNITPSPSSSPTSVSSSSSLSPPSILISSSSAQQCQQQQKLITTTTATSLKHLSELVSVSTSSPLSASSPMNITSLNKIPSNSSSGSSNISNKNPTLALSPPTPTTVADFLQQQFQQMQNQMRITSPALMAASVVNTGISSMQSSVPVTSAAPLSSLTASLAVAVGSGTVGDLSTKSNSVKLINEFLQHQLQQQQHASGSACVTCPNHPDVKGIDCKNCELIDINLKSPMTPTRSPISVNLFSSNSTVSPTAAAAPSFTIGACPEHINGRSLGVDCSRCEMILNSARLNSGVQISTRNSCKTLKCPQCNWHYKYQETLEIHMREKHPDGESACGYCLAGQQHPRLARGESYTCGYKPYRCEICNYSTTTKGNLSIHMQSDKHLNNMQELNSSQNMTTTGSEIRESPKIIMPNMQQQTSKPKPNFRCDVCSYETSVARNLRIHMTSEKHTHNMAVLQNNIKHIQAFSFLQSQNLGQLSAAQSAAVAASNLSNIPNLQNFLPEAALADIAYNQALMIQLIHQNSAAGALSAAAVAAAAANPINLPQQSPAGSGAVTVTAVPASATSTSSQQSYQNSQTAKLNQAQHTPPTTPSIILPASSSMTSSLPISSTTLSSPSQQQQQHSAVGAVALLAEAAAAAAAVAASGDSVTSLQQLQQHQPQQQQQQQPDSSLDPPIDPDPKPTTLFSCLICVSYNTNNIDELNNHLMIDRSRNVNNNCSDIMMIINNNYICRLCNYKTNLKANFQLHSKTDKHLQKLNYINHVREGGIKNEYKLKYNQANTVQLKCNCCDFYANSIQKLNLHTQHMRHDTMKIIFNHILYLMSSFNCNSSSTGGEGTQSQLMAKGKVLTCQLCNFNAINILQMVQHVKSLRHVQVEQFICMQRRSENLDSLSLGDVFKITDCVKSEPSSPDPSLEGLPFRLKQGNEHHDSHSQSPDNPHSIAESPILGAGSATGTSSTYVKDLVDVDLSKFPSIIYKCNNCDYFAQIKSEMEHHIANLHPNASEQDYLTIPTNPSALQAFHAAVTAAAAAANAATSLQQESCSKSPSPARLQNNQLNEQSAFGESTCRNDLLTKVKTERMETTDDDAQSNDECELYEDPNESSSILQSSAACSSTNSGVMCPLCQDTFNEKKALEVHLMGVHSVNSDGLARLLQLVDNTSWLNTSRRSSTSTTPEPRNSSTPHSDVGQSQQQQQQQQQQHQHLFCSSSTLSSGPQYACAGEEYACPQCGIVFKLQQHLLIHANDMQHYQMVDEQYQCLAHHCSQLFSTILQMLSHYKDTHMNIVISERHVYKYRCKQCSLAFKTQEKLNTHSLYHTMRDATKCVICNRNFRSTQSLQRHMEQAHNQMQLTGSSIPSPNSSGEPSNVAASVSVTPAISRDDTSPKAQTAAPTGTKTDIFSKTALLQQISKKHNNVDYDDVGDDQTVISTPKPVPPPLLLPPPLPPPETASSTSKNVDDYDPESKRSCIKCKAYYTNPSYLAKHSNQRHRNEKPNMYSLEKYLDPNRPFKCEICLESFTQRNILLVHYNRVSHLRKMKKNQINLYSVSDSTGLGSKSKGPTIQPSAAGGCSSLQCGGAGSVATNDKLLHLQRRSTVETIVDENSKERFKCDICKFAYDKGSTLDIPMRGVLHASRLHDQLFLQYKFSHTPPLSSESPALTHVPTALNDFNDKSYRSLLETYGCDNAKQFSEINKICSSNELANFYCHYCDKVFSSVFVLKAHCEDIHNEKLPLELLEKFAEKLKNIYFDQRLLSSPSSSSLLFPINCHCTNQTSKANLETNLGETSVACSESNSLSPMHPESVVSDGDNSSILPLTTQSVPVAGPNTAAVSAVASALLKQQQQQKLNLDPAILAQKMVEQNFSNFPPNFPGLPQNFPNIQSLQSLQSLQNMQHNLPNMSNPPINTLDMLNLMQFHHLMSLNFMNLAPPLIFGGAGAGPSPSVTGSSSSGAEHPSTPATQVIQQQASSTTQNTSSQKRARTRITDDQLKILRAHFDINNSPSEESIMEMSKKANLPMKVVKHWFRNTLFKERQRNKDSPYNFNNPPSTTLNLEEYERTGQAKVTPLLENGGSESNSFYLQQQQQREQHQHQREQQQQIETQQMQQQHPASSQSSEINLSQLNFQHQQQQQHQQYDLPRQHQQHQQEDNRPLSHTSSVTSDRGEIHIKSEPADDIGSSDCDQHILSNKEQQHDNEQSMMQSHHQQSMFYNNFETKSESGSSEILSRPQTPNSTSTPYSSNVSDILSQQIDNLPLNNMANISNLNNMGPPKKFQLNKIFEKSSNFETNSNSSNSSTSSGKRANRTRFTDYQIKVLQEFFENNSYPKDSDLEYLSKLLLLSPRVIVVWFQNARQKQRKIYENQPNNTFYESEEKKQNINYACKKCNLVFQRYYELIRHQKNHCFKEENNKKSAKAQIAAAQVAQSLSSEDSNSSIDINNANMPPSNLTGQQAVVAIAAAGAAAGITAGGPAVSPVISGLSTSPGINVLTSPQHIVKQQKQSVVGSGVSLHMDSTSPLQKFECDKCHLNFNRFELFKEHQLIHMMNPNLFMHQNFSESSPFGVLHNSQQDTSIDLSRQKKRKYSETQASSDEQQQPQSDCEAFSKKFKNNQYQFLYQYYMQNESNADMRKQYQQQQQQQQQQPEHDFDYLFNFYQQNELKKRSNYDFLYQYYLRNETKQQSIGGAAASLILLNDDTSKPNMDFLVQYYQHSESKKFFQLEASPQRIHDFPPLLNLTRDTGIAIIPQQQQTTADNTSETNEMIINSFTANNCVNTASISPPLATNNNSSEDNISSISGHSQIPSPMLLATGGNILTAPTTTCAGSGVQKTTQDSASTITGQGSTISRNSCNGQTASHRQKHQENPLLISICNDNASPVTGAKVAASELAVHSLKLPFNNQYVNSQKTNQTNNKSISLDTDTETTATVHHQQQQQQQNDNSTSAPHNVTVAHHHSSEETITTTEKQNNKRLRTTILPEQLNFLYECYQNESNPSRKMLEEISKKVNLKKRVVQVWYQNSRARERKGQFRQNIQIINKKCPHCAAIFKIKSALEWHLQSKHTDKHSINVDQIPDLKLADSLLNLAYTTSGSTFGTESDHQQQQQHQTNNKKELNSPTTQATTVTPTATASTIMTLVKNSSSLPLDLSKVQQPFLSHHTSKYEQSESEISFSDSNNDHDESNDLFTSHNRALNSGGGTQARNCDANTLDMAYTHDHNMPNGDYYGNDRDNTNSPISQTSSNHGGQQKKRFRTQMSNLQVRILKTLFQDVKSPTMTDCLNIGREIGLQKRVIQVWFQNARAKEKKSRNQRYSQDENTSENDAMSLKSNADSTTNIPEIRNCNICGLSSVNIQEHVFSAQHIAHVRVLMESNGKIKDESQHQANEYELSGAYLQLYGQYKNTNNTTDIQRADVYADADIDADGDINADSNVDGDNQYSINTDATDGHTEDEDDTTITQSQSEDVALNEISKAALALKNFNKLQQHFAAATALAKQQQHHQQEHLSDTATSVSPPAVENNVMLKIDTDNPLTSNHTEILQQLFNYSQMSVIGGK